MHNGVTIPKGFETECGKSSFVSIGRLATQTIEASIVFSDQ